MQGLGYNEVPQSSDPIEQYRNAKLQTAQLKTLVNSINPDDTSISPKMNRYLTSAALLVFLCGGNIKDVFNVLQRHKVRYQFIDKLPASQTEHMEEYLESLYELDEVKEDKKTKQPIIVGTKDHLDRDY
jgi:hypothetical protein